MSPNSVARKAKNRFAQSQFSKPRKSTLMEKRQLLLEELESRTLMDANPVATLTVPPNALIGSTFNASVALTNTGNATGYAPYVDVYLPSTGDQPNNQGVTFKSATYLGQNVTPIILTFDASGHAKSPYGVDSSGNPLILTGTPGDQVAVFQMPFGSFTNGQPPATLNLTLNMSDHAFVAQPMNISADAGFAYGDSPVFMPATDPTIVGAQATAPIDPTVLILKKIYLGPEQETATGPNFKHQYELDVTVANGQTVTADDLKDLLPNNMQFVSLDSVTFSGAGNSGATWTPNTLPSTSTPGGTIDGTISSLTGDGNVDAKLLFTFYIPEYDNTNADVLPLSSGAFEPSVNNASVAGTYKPLNTNDPAANKPISATAQDKITDKSIAIQKGVTNLTHPGDTQPGDILKYTLNFQVSDFFAFQQVLSQDLISDGQLIYDPAGYTPSITYTQHGSTVSGAFTPSNWNFTPQDTTSGITTTTFNVSQQVSDLGNATGGRLLARRSLTAELAALIQIRYLPSPGRPERLRSTPRCRTSTPTIRRHLLVLPRHRSSKATT